MATLSDVKLQIAGIGHVYTAPVDTAPIDRTQFVFGDESTHTGWTWLGDTSAENLIEFETDGGDITQKRTWDRQNVRAIREAQSVTGTINSVNVSGESLQFAFPGSTYDEAAGSYAVKSGGARSVAVMVVIEDAGQAAGMYLPNVDVKGSFPALSLEEFTEFPLSLAILSSPTTQVEWQWFEPRNYVGGGTAEPASPAA